MYLNRFISNSRDTCVYQTRTLYSPRKIRDRARGKERSQIKEERKKKKRRLKLHDNKISKCPGIIVYVCIWLGVLIHLVFLQRVCVEQDRARIRVKKTYMYKNIVRERERAIESRIG